MSETRGGFLKDYSVQTFSKEIFRPLMHRAQFSKTRMEKLQ